MMKRRGNWMMYRLAGERAGSQSARITSMNTKLDIRLYLLMKLYHVSTHALSARMYTMSTMIKYV